MPRSVVRGGWRPPLHTSCRPTSSEVDVQDSGPCPWVTCIAALMSGARRAGNSGPRPLRRQHQQKSPVHATTNTTSTTNTTRQTPAVRTTTNTTSTADTASPAASTRRHYQHHTLPVTASVSWLTCLQRHPAVAIRRAVVTFVLGLWCGDGGGDRQSMRCWQ